MHREVEPSTAPGARPAAPALLTGKTLDHLGIWRDEAGECRLHREVIAPLRALCERAASAGIRLCVASGFRSFERQLAIWNAKARGERPVFDASGQPCPWTQMTERERVHAILRWSALPGASRHHWGTDVDVWDAAAVAPAYRLRLEPEEYAPGGPFHRLSQWLAVELNEAAGFVRPYDGTTGVAAEPWHLSYLPLAADFERQLTPALLRASMAGAEMELRAAVEAELETIHARFITTLTLQPPG